MLNYIKSQLAEREKANTIEFDDDIDSSIVVECAHVFQELDDISAEGTDAVADRPVAIDIPLEDDLEIESVEFNIGDGRITDVPMDTSVQESTQMKSFDDFYQESYDETTRFPRDTEESFKNRVMNNALDKQKDYIADAEKKGLFGFNKIDIYSDDVPIAIKLVVDTDNRSVVAPVYWETGRLGHTINKNQKDMTIKLVDSEQAKLIPAFIAEYFKSRYPDEVDKFNSIWEVLGTPVIYIPVQKGNPTVIIDYGKTYFTDEDGELVWEITIPTSSDSSAKIEHINNSPNNMINFKSFKTKKEIIKEYAISKKSYSRFDEDQTYYQEAIEFGNSDDSTTNSEPASSDEDTSPTVSMGNDNSTDTGDTLTDDTKEDTLPVETNDVSDDIAKKVSDDTNTEDTDKLDESSIDDNTDTEGVGDTSDTSAEGDDSSIDGKLDELNDMGNTDDTSLDDASDNNIDFDDMTMDDLLEKGTEKLKGMTMAQLKEFMNGNPDTKIDDTMTQESFFMTSKNINKKLYDQLKVVSGILNNTEMEFCDIVSAFKKQGKSLNKILTKAAKAKKVYTEEDVKTITKLNSVLVDLINQFKPQLSQNETVLIKRLIKEFVSCAVAVNKIIERVGNDKPVQESFQVSGSNKTNITTANKIY